MNAPIIDQCLDRPPDSELWSLLDAAAFAVYRLRELELAPFGLTVEQAAILDLLGGVGWSTSAKEIERVTLRQHQTVSTLISRMSRRGLVTRKRMPAGQGYRIFATAEGRALFGKLPIGSIAAVFSPFEAADRVQLGASLRSLHQEARRLLVAPYPTPLHVVGDTLDDSTLPDRNEDEPHSDYRLWSLLDRARFAIGRLRELELGRLGITVEQASILKILEDSGGSADTRALENETMRQHHSISALVNRMSRTGLLRKERTGGRARHKFVITEKGRDVAHMMTASGLHAAFSVLEPDEKQKLAASLRVVHARALGLLRANDLQSDGMLP